VIARWAYDASLNSVGDARRFAAAMVTDQPDEVRESVALVVSELCTNALVHATTGFELTVERTDRWVRVAVTDAGEGTPSVRSPGTQEPHGRGLRIVESLSDDWGIDVAPGQGKTVWARLRMTGDRATAG